MKTDFIFMMSRGGVKSVVRGHVICRTTWRSGSLRPSPERLE